MNCVFDFQITKLMPLLAVAILDPISICHGVHGVRLMLENSLMSTFAFQLHAIMANKFLMPACTTLTYLTGFFL